jgi:hypothetical protein
MPNGKHGDHPLTDILIHKVSVFSPTIDNLITEIAEFIPVYKLREMFNWFSPPSLPEFEHQLRDILDKLKEEAKKNGWETNKNP